MSAAAFCLLVLNVLGTPKPKFAQLASSVFGLFYCGTTPGPQCCVVRCTADKQLSVEHHPHCLLLSRRSQQRRPSACSMQQSASAARQQACC